MINRFEINNRNNNIDIIKQYHKLRTTIADVQIQSNDLEYIYNIKDEYGQGSIRLYHLTSKALMIIYDVMFYNGLEISFDLDDTYFEIEYCLEGNLLIKENDKETILDENKISISKSSNNKGSIINKPNTKYKGISITTNIEDLSNYFGHGVMSLWNETIESLQDEDRLKYYQGIETPLEIGSIFKEIEEYNMNGAKDIIFYEGKLMEVLTKIINNEVKMKSNVLSIDQFERKQIELIPRILMENTDDLPTIEDLSQLLALNKNKLNEGFKLIYGDTIYVHHRKLCLNKAAQLLVDTNLSLIEIALECGYSSSSNFGYAFKKMYHYTPQQYRKLHNR